MTSIKEALEIVWCMIQGDQIEAAIVDTDTMASLGDVVRAALAQLDSADAREVWRKAGDVPLIKPGASQQYILAVYRKHSGKVYSFAAEYLNDYPLRYDWGCQKDHKGICDGCSEDGCPTTGWYVTEGADDDGYTYHALSLSDGDRIEGWREVPRWEDRSTGLLPDASPGNGAEKVREHPIETAQRGFNAWAAKEHNKKWFKRIDGTPIPNDLVVCIAMEFSALHSTSAAGETTKSDGGVEGHARDIADSGRASVRGDDGAPESPYPTKAGIKPGPSDPPSEAADVLAMKEALGLAFPILTRLAESQRQERGGNGLMEGPSCNTAEYLAYLAVRAAIDKLSPEVKADASPPDWKQDQAETTRIKPPATAEGGRGEPVACVFCRHLISNDDKAVVDCNGEIACAACGESEFRAQEQER